MFSRNLTITKFENDYLLQFNAPELDSLVTKHKGIVTVKITAPQSAGTDEQNRAMHGLLMEYYKTGMHSSPENTTLEEFKVFMKMSYGPVYSIPFKGGIASVPKSWSDYTKEERSAMIDGLISEIHQSGAYTSSAKLREIIDGMAERSKSGDA